MDIKTLHINVPDSDISNDAHAISDFVMEISDHLGAIALYVNANAQLADLACYLHTVATQIALGPVAVHKGFTAVYESIKDELPPETRYHGAEVIRTSPFAGYENDEEFSKTMRIIKESNSIIVPFHSKSSN